MSDSESNRCIVCARIYADKRGQTSYGPTVGYKGKSCDLEIHSQLPTHNHICIHCIVTILLHTQCVGYYDNTILTNVRFCE